MSLRGVGTKDYYLKYYSTRHWNFYNHILAEIVNHSRPGPILDMGAGTGLLTEAATHWGFDCVGIEASSEAVEIARQRFPQIRLNEHNLGNKLNFPENSFQTVILNQVIEHLEPQAAKQALMECLRVLRPGGMLYLASPSSYNKAEAKDDPTHINLYRPRDLKNLLLTLGFAKVIPNNLPLYFLGKSFLGRGLMVGFFKLFPIDRLSATASFYAYKP